MSPKYFVHDNVTFTSEGKHFTGVIQGIKESTGKANGDNDPLYFVWTGNQGIWVRESWVTVKSS